MGTVGAGEMGSTSRNTGISQEFPGEGASMTVVGQGAGCRACAHLPWLFMSNALSISSLPCLSRCQNDEGFMVAGERGKKGGEWAGGKQLHC